MEARVRNVVQENINPRSDLSNVQRVPTFQMPILAVHQYKIANAMLVISGQTVALVLHVNRASTKKP
jgi:hypothetical protein